MTTVAFTISGVPRTKKNNMRPVKRGGRMFLIPSAAWCAYEKEARFTTTPRLPPGKWNVAALVYRDARRGDMLNFLAGTSDIMESRGVVENDRDFVSWDGSRMLLDAKNPRVEVTITPATYDTGDKS